jgi:hypothetical protein
MKILKDVQTNHQPTPTNPWLAMHAAWLKASMDNFEHAFICKEPEVAMQVRVMDKTGRKAFRIACTCCGKHADLPQEPLWAEAWVALESSAQEREVTEPKFPNPD